MSRFAAEPIRDSAGDANTAAPRPVRAADDEVTRSCATDDAGGEKTGLPRIRVLVVDEHGDPAPGAELRWRERVDDDDLPAKLRFLAQRTDAPAAATTDAAGVAVVPVPAGDVVLTAARGDGYGELTIDPGPNTFEPELAFTHRLQLARDHTLRVDVVDTDGRPCANVPLLGAGHVVARRSGSRDLFFVI